VKVLVVGAGNLGTTLTNLLLAHRTLLGIGEVVVRKVRESPAFDGPDLTALADRGARIVRAATEGTARELLASVDYVFDCRKEGAALRDQELYLGLSHLRGVSAQGSETGFGPPFVGGINPRSAAGARLVQIASCNTHATATLLAALGGPGLANLEEADLVCVRRCEDLGARERLVGASVVARHRDPEHGTHHAADAARVFATLDLAPSITSSDVTTPTQLMHALRFHLRLRDARTHEQVATALREEWRLATTGKFDSNRVFELGRRYGFQGRLYAHAVVVVNDLHVRDRVVRGWAFVPQEGNTLLSTLEAFLLQTGHPHATEATRKLSQALIAPTL
jgi:glyceraldehyde-3-phosphate dehydrogenase/erythrose-4-phosphate dehydrogenase